MGNRVAIETDKAPAAVGPYSQAIVAGGFVFVSGQVAFNAQGELLNNGSIETETHQVMENIAAILEAAAVGFGDVVMTRIYVTDVSWFPRVNEVYESFMKKPYPARALIGVRELPLGAQVEIEIQALAASSARE